MTSEGEVEALREAVEKLRQLATTVAGVWGYHNVAEEMHGVADKIEAAADDFLPDGAARKEGGAPAVRGDLHGTCVEWPDRQPMLASPSGPFDPDELVEWAEKYGHPEVWAKRAQELHAKLESRVPADGEMPTWGAPDPASYRGGGIMGKRPADGEQPETRRCGSCAGTGKQPLDREKVCPMCGGWGWLPPPPPPDFREQPAGLREDPRPSPTPGQTWRIQKATDHRGKPYVFIDGPDTDLIEVVSSSVPAAGLSEEALEAAERATATAEKLIDAITRVGVYLNNEKLADKAKINKARTVIAGLDQ